MHLSTLSLVMACLENARSFQLLQLNILVPDIAAVVLETDVAFARMILIDDVELVLGAIGAFVRHVPLIEVCPSHLNAVHFDVDQVSVAGNLHMVPFALRFHRVL